MLSPACIANTVRRMMKDRGIDALVNDCLIGPVLTMGSTASAFLCSFLAYLYLEFTKPAYNTGGNFTAVVMAYAFLIGLQVAQIFLTPIGSGVDTFFVAAAFDPEGQFDPNPKLKCIAGRLTHIVFSFDARSSGAVCKTHTGIPQGPANDPCLKNESSRGSVGCFGSGCLYMVLIPGSKARSALFRLNNAHCFPLTCSWRLYDTSLVL